MFGSQSGFGTPFSGAGSSFASFVWLIAIVIIAGVVWRGRKTYVSGTSVVLKRFVLNHDPSAHVAVDIAGRASGIVSWVLTLLKLEPEVRLLVTDSEVSIRSASLSGISNTYIPLAQIYAVTCGYQRSILAIGFAALFAVGFVLNLLSGMFGNNSNDFGLAFGFLIFAGIATLIYYLSKRIGIAVETAHGHGLAFKRSVIENVSVDLPQALLAIELINTRIRLAHSGLASTVSAKPAGAAASPMNATAQCPKCGTVNPVGLRFCENCGCALPEVGRAAWV